MNSHTKKLNNILKIVFNYPHLESANTDRVIKFRKYNHKVGRKTTKYTTCIDPDVS